MPQEAMEVVRRAFDLWNAGDYEGWKRTFAPDVVVVALEGWPEEETLRGRDAWVAQAARLRDSWTEQRIEAREFELVGEWVILSFRWYTRGKDSGIDLETDMVALTAVRDGLIVRQEFFYDLDGARKRAQELGSEAQ